MSRIPIPITHVRQHHVVQGLRAVETPGLYCARTPFASHELELEGKRVSYEFYTAVHDEERAILTRRVMHCESCVTTDETIDKWKDVAIFSPEVQNVSIDPDDSPVLDEAI